MVPSRFKKQHVYLQTNLQENPFKCQILSIEEEAGMLFYLVEYPDGQREAIFLSSIDSIRPVSCGTKKNAKVLNFKKLRTLTLIK